MKRKELEIEKKIILFIIGFVMICIFITVVFPKERKRNSEALIRMGAGDDMSGILMKEIEENLSGKYEIAESLESDQFVDC